MQNSCIEISAARISSPLSFSCGRTDAGVAVNASRHCPAIAYRISRIGDLPDIWARRTGAPLSFRCGLVCTVGSELYLRVPKDDIWLLPDNGFSEEVVVYANVTWTIE